MPTTKRDKRKNRGSFLKKRNAKLQTFRKQTKKPGRLLKENLDAFLPSRLRSPAVTSQSIYTIDSSAKSYSSVFWRDESGPRVLLKNIKSGSINDSSAEFLSDFEKIADRGDGFDHENPLPSEVIIQVTDESEIEGANSLMKKIIEDANDEYGSKYFSIDPVQITGKDGVFLSFRIVENLPDSLDVGTRVRSKSLSSSLDRSSLPLNLQYTRSRTRSLSGSFDRSTTLHDEMFNNRRKIAFESGMAGALFQQSSDFNQVVNDTLKNLGQIIPPAIIAAAQIRSGTDSQNALFNLLAKDPNTMRAFAARQSGKSPETLPLNEVETINQSNQEDRNKLRTYITGLFTGTLDPPATFEEKLTVIYNFSDFMTRPYKFDISAGKTLKKLTDIQLEGLTEPQKLQILTSWQKFKQQSPIPGLFDKTAHNASESRYPRKRKKDGIDTVSVKTNLSEGVSGLFPVSTGRPKDALPENPHAGLVADQTHSAFYNVTGVGLWQPGIAAPRVEPDGSDLANRERDFAYEAMYRHDMPLIGGASGGMGSYLLTFSAIGKLKGPDLQKAFLAAASVMIGKGYHSFHELATIAQTFGLQYRPGDYLSMIPDEVILGNENLKEMVLRFPEIVFGTELNSLLNGIEGLALGRSVNWNKRNEDFSAKIDRWSKIYNAVEDPAKKNEMLTIYENYIREMGISSNTVNELLSMDAQTASKVRIASLPTVGLGTISKIELGMRNIVRKISDAPNDSSIDLSEEIATMNQLIDTWTAEFEQIPRENQRAFNAELDRINTIVNDELGMNMSQFNEFISGNTQFTKV